MNFNAAISLINDSRRILLTSHVRPDGDAVGSTAGLQRLIEADARAKRRDCSTQLLFLSEVPDNYAFLLSRPAWVLNQQITAEQITACVLDEFDLIIIIDTSAPRQLTDLSDYLLQRKKPILVIDHHLAGDGIGSCRLIDTAAAASGQIVFELSRHARWPLDTDSAAGLFAAISTDTGWFHFENSSPRAYEVAAELVAAGARPDDLYHQLMENYPPQRLRLKAMTLETFELHCNSRLAVMRITRDILRRSGARRQHVENLVNECFQAGSVEIAVLLVELENGDTRVSLRSRNDVDVNRIARRFSGGGHARAAGATLNMPTDQAHEQIIAVIGAELAGFVQD